MSANIYYRQINPKEQQRLNVGSPLSDDWPEYHTHFTPLIPILTPEDMGVK